MRDLFLLLLFLTAAFMPAALRAEPAIEGYADFAALTAAVKTLDVADTVTAESLGKTLGGREVWLLTIGTGRTEEKPGILIVGNVEAAHLVGSELAMRVAQQLVERAAKEEVGKELLQRFTFYVIPRPNPDASEAFFRRPYLELSANERATDDDRDGETNEDPPQDLNGDGQITMIRVEDETGTYLPHPGDPRVMIEADARKNECGKYTLYTEGTDDDGDEKFNEDGPGGVSFNRNFTHRYPYFQPGAGPHQASEVETRAVADFAFSHPNIALVLTFSPEDNLMEPWKPSSSGDSERIKTAVLSGDASYLNYVAEEYRTIHGGKDAPSSPKGEGSFVDWAYFHYGRWSLAARGWWIPKTAEKEKSKEEKADEKDDAKAKDSAKKAADEKRGADDVNALRWFAGEKIAGFVDWKPIEHPDFKGKRVEVGGFKPFLRLNPLAKELGPLAQKHVQFVLRLADLMPRIEIAESKIDNLGGGVFRVTAAVVNTGYLPTMPAMGRTSGEPYPLQIKIELGEGQKLATGSERTQLSPLAGNGGKAERSWLVLAPKIKLPKVKLSVWSPSVGRDETNVELK